MAKQALIEQRPWLLLSVVAATAFYFLRDNPVGEGTWGLLAKGLSVGLLAAYAWLRVPRDRRWTDGILLVVALALAAAGDVAIELYFSVGGALFAAAHCFAVALYLRNRRQRPSPSQRMLALALLIGTPLISYLVSERADVAIYASFLGAMAAAAWMSRFPRYRVGTGAVLFVVSDWLIFARFGSYDFGVLPDLLIWPLYFAGQLMIATGIVQCLRGEQPVR
ncbi:lysoplasmalogenase family protein [Erythrobacter sp.]|uniref:lysoplasmalogenase family protein n=1 Tax=Erythrobacter sp. TaxID=1042 RepID=UPI0025E8B290|nr:lysoplasmalogenase family protein [Erythrobacter sp.]